MHELRAWFVNAKISSDIRKWREIELWKSSKRRRDREVPDALRGTADHHGPNFCKPSDDRVYGLSDTLASERFIQNLTRCNHQKQALETCHLGLIDPNIIKGTK